MDPQVLTLERHDGERRGIWRKMWSGNDDGVDDDIIINFGNIPNIINIVINICVTKDITTIIIKNITMNHEDQRWPGGVSNSRKGFMVASNALPAFPYKEEAVFPTCEIIITIITSATQIGFVLNLFINWSPSYLLYRYMMTVKTQWRCWHKVLPWLRCLSVSDVNSRRKEISRW